LILGHAPPDVVKAVQQAVELGLSFPGPTEHEVRLAELLTRRVPSVQAIRFTNSGTEATMNAVRLARAFTGRTKIAKFEGAYHGTHDWVMVSVSGDAKATGSRKRPKPVAWSAGIPPAVLKHVVVLPWNDAEACAEILEAEAGQLACLIVDPMMCNAGLVPPADGFLARLREITERHSIVLIFDEVISFRTAWGGAQERFGIRPDLTTFGKIIGGGLPVGAFGGRRDIMDFYDPRKGGARISHGGTFNANPVTMAAGLAGMRMLTREAYDRLDDLGTKLRSSLDDCFRQAGVSGRVTGMGSLFRLHAVDRELTDYRSTRTTPAEGERLVRLVRRLMEHGVLMSVTGLGCLSTPMGDAELEGLVETFAAVLEMERGGLPPGRQRPVRIGSWDSRATTGSWRLPRRCPIGRWWCSPIPTTPRSAREGWWPGGWRGAVRSPMCCVPMGIPAPPIGR
jgi:glutamate-1-semialdehyde 2,1-aminomutase